MRSRLVEMTGRKIDDLLDEGSLPPKADDGRRSLMPRKAGQPPRPSKGEKRRAWLREQQRREREAAR